MLQEVQTIRRWDGLEPVAGATRDWSGGEAVELGEESGGGERRGSRERVVLKAADEAIFWSGERASVRSTQFPFK